MKIIRYSMAGLAAFAAAISGLAQANVMREPELTTLKPGNPAFELTTGEWLKGTPIKSYAKGHWYVLEFWATWCGPCRQAMPHLSALARQYKGRVSFVGINVWEGAHQRDKTADWMPRVRSFVTKIGDGMDYNVLVDDKAGTLGDTWLTANNIRGIPVTFLIDGDGKVAWTGSPHALDEQLQRRLDGVSVDRDLGTREERLKYMADYKELVAGGDYAKALAFIDRTEHDPRFEFLKDTNVLRRYALLTHLDPAGARQLGERLFTTYADAPMDLIQLAKVVLVQSEEFGLVSPAAKTPDIDLALKALRSAWARTVPSDAMLPGVAEAFFKAGDVQTAVEIQRQWVHFLEKDPAGYDFPAEMRESAKEALKKYEAAPRPRAK